MEVTVPRSPRPRHWRAPRYPGASTPLALTVVVAPVVDAATLAERREWVRWFAGRGFKRREAEHLAELWWRVGVAGGPEAMDQIQRSKE